MPFSLHRLVRASSIGCLSLVIAARPVGAQFTFNGGTAGTVVPSIANQSCVAGAAIGGGGMGGMGGNGNCDGTPFLQEVTTIGGADYYHIVVGSGANFSLEYYIGTAGGTVCWFGCAGARVPIAGGMGGMAGGGVAPLSASSGSATNDSAPLAASNSGTGAPDRSAIRMTLSDGQMTQEFLKATTANKPRITQTVTTADTTINFAIDMSSISYADATRAGTLTLQQTVTSPNFPAPQTLPQTNIALPNSANFNIAQALNNTSIRTINGGTPQITQTPNDRTNAVTGGRYTYTPGGGDGGSLGAYSYFRDSFDVYNINWTSFCDPAQNPVSACVNYGGVRGGAGAMGGAATGGAATGGTAAGGTAGGGMGGAATTVAPTTTTTTLVGTTTTSVISGTTTTTTLASTTTTTVSGGGMGTSGGGMGGL